MQRSLGDLLCKISLRPSLGLPSNTVSRIYIVRLALTTYYDYRTSLVQAQLDGLEGQRNQTIEKLKTATKYNSTQELLKKYGGTPTPKEKSTRKPESKGTTQQDGTGTPRNERTKFVPPPTANIPRGVQSPNSQRMPPQTPHRRVASPTAESSPLWQRPAFPRESSAEFAANAFSAPPQYAPINESPRWFDRIIDVLLGEDESLPGKRLALICKNCRLVNGQAPPGAKRIEDVGKWQCAACGTMNGEENEVTSMLASIKDQVPEDKAGDNGEPTDEKAAATADAGHESDVTQYSSKEGGSEKHTKEAVTPRRRSTRTRKRDKEED